MPHQAIITLSLSEAQWDLYPDQAGDNFEHKIVLDLPHGPWVQFRYEGMTNQDGDEKGLPFYSTGLWTINGGDDRVWTDMTVEIIKADHVAAA